MILSHSFAALLLTLTLALNNVHALPNPRSSDLQRRILDDLPAVIQRSVEVSPSRQDLIARNLERRDKKENMCGICGSGFDTPERLSNHLSQTHERVTGPGFWRCGYCGVSNEYKYAHTTHLDSQAHRSKKDPDGASHTFSDRYNYYCDNCCKYFRRTAWLEHKKNTKHGGRRVFGPVRPGLNSDGTPSAGPSNSHGQHRNQPGPSYTLPHPNQQTWGPYDQRLQHTNQRQQVLPSLRDGFGPSPSPPETPALPPGYRPTIQRLGTPPRPPSRQGSLPGFQQGFGHALTPPPRSPQQTRRGW